MWAISAFAVTCLRPGWKGRISKTPEGATVNGEDGCLLQGSPVSPLDDNANDYQGVTCHFCHRAESTGPLGESVPVDNASIWVDDVTCPGSDEPCRKGPYSYQESSALKPPHAWEQSSEISQSATCGTCHDVSAPRIPGGKTLILADGTDTGRPFPIERTFSEWSQSDFADLILIDGIETETQQLTSGRTCQSCHMPLAPDATARAAQQGETGSRAGETSSARVRGVATPGFPLC